MTASALPEIDMYAASEDSRFVFPSSLKEMVVSGGHPDGSEKWLLEAFSTRTLLDGRDVYTGSSIDRPSGVASLLISCYFMFPEPGREGFRGSLALDFPAQNLPPLKFDGSTFEKYDDWALEAKHLDSWLAGIGGRGENVSSVRVVSSGARSSHDFPALIYVGREASFRLLEVHGNVIG